MSKFQIEVAYENESGDEFTYIFHCRSLTNRDLRTALDENREIQQAEEDGDYDEADRLRAKYGNDPVSRRAFKRITEEGPEDKRDMAVDDVPVEVIADAVEKHPSFRNRDKSRSRRRGR